MVIINFPNAKIRQLIVSSMLLITSISVKVSAFTSPHPEIPHNRPGVHD